MPPPQKSCPLCGRMFGSASIDIHVPQCHAKALQRWEMLPLRERGPRPEMPVKRRAPAAAAAPFQQPQHQQGGIAGLQRRSSSSMARQQPPHRFVPGHDGDGGDAYPPVSMPDRRSAGSVAKPTRIGQQQQHASPGRTTGGGGGGIIPRPGGLGEYELPAGGGGHLQQCRHCKRKFNFDRVQRHEAACVERPGGNRRTSSRPFNSTKQRLGELAGEAQSLRGGGTRTRFGGRTGGGPSRSAVSAAPSRPRVNWRQQHHEFQQAMRAARMDRQVSRPQQQQYGGGRSSLGARSGGGAPAAASSRFGGGNVGVTVAAPARGPLPAGGLASRGAATGGFGGGFGGAAAASRGGPATLSHGFGGGRGPSGAPGTRGGSGAGMGNAASAARFGGGGGGAGGGGGSGRISTSNETSSDMRAIFGGGGGRR